MSKLTKALTAAAGNAGGDNLYVEDVFSTYLYTGTGSTRSITNNIDLSGEGGLTWIKRRTNGSYSHQLLDTERSAAGGYNALSTNSTAAENFTFGWVFNSDGFTINGGSGPTNASSEDYASWSFRKAEKFFDVQTYTGNGGTPQNISHSLGSVPGTILVKRTDSAFKWFVYHTSTGATKYLQLNDTAAAVNYGGYWNSTAPTDSVFTIGTDTNGNASGGTYVAYLFASDAGGFGDDGSENIIKCGSYTGTGATGLVVDLGFEPQWVMIKRATGSTGDWLVVDNMRDLSISSENQLVLRPNLSDAESGRAQVWPTGTGFIIGSAGTTTNAVGDTYIYVAIRRPMKTPESGTEVFALQDPGYPLGSNGLAYTSGFPVDLALLKERTSSSDGWYTMSRMQGSGRYMKTNLTNAETSGVSNGTFDHNTGWYKTTNASMSWMFKRATGFMDVVAYSGNSVAGRAVAHNLGVVPELMIVKRRNQGSGQGWNVYAASLGNTSFITLNTNQSAFTSQPVWNSTTPTSSVFYLNDDAEVNNSSYTYIAYLFATLAGVSKVGSYTGTGGNLNVDCGFSAGARFILIKRTDSTGDWYVWDSVRGIVAGNDPYMLLNSAAAEVTNTDYIDPLSSGFTVTSSAPAALNASGGTYIFLAIA